MENAVQKAVDGRKSYRKPQLRHVKLVAEEAVLLTCKLQGGGVFGPNNTNCRGLLGSDCVTQGS